jgi:rsbT co-antagonist protein RsbR
MMMDRALEGLKETLEQRVHETLTQQAMTNRGTFPPFRLAATAQSLVAGLMIDEGDVATAARALGQSLGQQGLGLPALLEAQTAVLETIAGSREIDSGSTAVVHASRYFGLVVEGLADAEVKEIERQRAEMERTFLKATSQQREQEEVLRSAIRELSTPIVPVYEGILVLPLVGSIDTRRATEITERLLEAIAANQAEMVIIDVTGVPVMDTGTANNLLMTARAANLLGSQVVLVGIGAEIAQTIVHIGVELRGLVTLANLQAGIAYALEHLGMGIQPLNGRAHGR